MKPLNVPIVDWTNKSVWLIGASSGIGMACAIELASLGAKVAVSARSMEALNAFVRDHSSSIAVDIDVMNIDSIEKALNVVKNHQGIDVVIYCAGHYLEQSAGQYNLAEMVKHNDINYLGLCRVLSYILPPLMSQGYGHIGIISSVAGYQGLPKSLAYGPTKAALINLSESLYFDLHDLGIGVSLINPGFVQTPLTAQNNFHMPALISADVAAREMVKGWGKGDFEIHYPKRFTRVLKLLKLFPYALYFKLIKSATKQSKV